LRCEIVFLLNVELEKARMIGKVVVISAVVRPQPFQPEFGLRQKLSWRSGPKFKT